VPGSPIISVQERRRAGLRSLTNIIRVVSREWRDWLHKGPSRPPWGGFKMHSNQKIEHHVISSSLSDLAGH
jgi:hypothetical protein